MARPSPPGVVVVAAGLTWASAAMLLSMVVALTVTAWFLGPVFDSFGSHPIHARWWIAGAGISGIVVVFLVGVTAFHVWRGRRWAQVVLIALCLLAAPASLLLAYYVLPLVGTVTALVVAGLLLTPDARAWFRRP